MNNTQASPNPPGDLKPSSVPMFVTIGFDDNGYCGLTDPYKPCGITFANKLFASRKNPIGKGNKSTYDGTNCHATFFCTTNYIAKKQIVDPPEMVKKAWNNTIIAGHEIGNHTHSHPSGKNFSVKEWEKEMQKCKDQLTKPAPKNEAEMGYNPETGAGIAHDKIYGFRSPFLEYNDNTFKAVQNHGFLYDASVEEGWQSNQNGTDFLWPYTLDNGSPGHDFKMEDDKDRHLQPLLKHSGLWEIPIHVAVAPADLDCKKYGIEAGFRDKLFTRQDFFKTQDGKITGLDWNLLVDFKMNKSEYLATLKNTLDLRLKGNRCPFIFGAHSDAYSPGYNFPPNISWKERQEVLIEFLDYAQNYTDVRIVSIKEILDWIRTPVSL